MLSFPVCAAAQHPELVLWNHPNVAVCGWRVELFLRLAGVPYEVKTIDLAKGEQKSEDFLKLNHRGKVPVLEDKTNGVVLSESLAIINYLATLLNNPKNLVPAANPKESAKAQQLIFRWYNYLNRTGFEIGGLIFGAPIAEDAAANRLAELRNFENYLAESGAEFFVNDQFSLPDILILIELHEARLGGLDLAKAGLPKLQAFWDRAFQIEEVKQTSVEAAHYAWRDGALAAKGGLPDLYSKLY